MCVVLFIYLFIFLLLAESNSLPQIIGGAKGRGAKFTGGNRPGG